HFIRRADFQSEAPDFGFLVPSPSQPELAEAPDSVFEILDEATRPQIVEGTEYQVMICTPMEFLLSASEPPVGAGPRVQILDTQRVAGYDTAVLRADDAAALSQWLSARGYPSRPELQQWLEPYVRAHWVVTAFKIAKRARTAGMELGTSAVRMSFATERPFF